MLSLLPLHGLKQGLLMSNPRYVCCLKYGKKYSAQYVNNLYNMVKRNLTINYNFVCFTEDSTDIDPNIKTIPLPVNKHVQGWWYKPFFFNPELEVQGTLLFLDLDMIVFDNIDKLFTYKPGEFCIIRDFNRMRIHDYKKFNSSVFRLETGQHTHVYTDFIKDIKTNSKRWHGDQDWMKHKITSGYDFWPDEWIRSYKWEMRGNPRLVLDKTNGGRNFPNIGTPNIDPGNSIAVFHGDPNPHNCHDPWVKENWK